MRLAGIDGCKGGWIAILIDESLDLEAATVAADKQLGDLIDRNGISFALIDTPMGLADTIPGRSVEPELRAFLRGRASVVFNAPCRAAISALTYPEASAINRDVLGKGLSQQSWGIFPKIVEADKVMRDLGQGRVREGHPEVSFGLMNRNAAVLTSKKKQEGRTDRIRLLTGVGFLPDDLLKAKPTGFGAQTDDLLDAAALAWSAIRVHRQQHSSFPAVAHKDAFDLDMAVWA